MGIDTSHPSGADGVADELHTRVLQLVARAEDLTQRLEQAAEPSSWSPAGEAPMLHFAGVEAWVSECFLSMFSWRIDGQRWVWCPQWWQHSEAIWRLELLWRSWEAARLHPTGMSSWSIELDSHLRELLGDRGPFRHCRVEGERVACHVDPEPVTAEPAPAGWWEPY